MNSLNGYKTYIVAALAIIMTGLLGTGYINQQTYEIIMGVLGSLGLAALRAGVKNAQTPQ